MPEVSMTTFDQPALERWLPVPGFDDYEVSDLGRVRSLKRGAPRLMTSYWVPGGYRRASVRESNGGPKSTKRVHQLVLLAFVGPCPDGQVSRHLDGNPANNALANLAYGSQSENNLDKVRHGTDHNASKTECAHGHPFSDANTYVRVRGGRDCRACVIERGRRYRAKLRAA